MEAIVESIFSLQEEELNYEELYESLLQIYSNPLMINEAGVEELQSLYILNPYQINSLVAYRERFGQLLSFYELQAVPGFDLETIYRLLPFVTLENGEQTFNRPFTQRLLTEPNAYLMIRLRRVWETRQGFADPDSLNGRPATRYLGDPNDLYARFRMQHPKDFSLGFTLDKDAGEEFRWDPSTKRYGFNFLSYHFTLFDKGRWKTVALGDYRVQFGQGLVFGSGYSAGKGAETITTVRRSSLGIRPYTSVTEFGYFRGAAATYSLGNVEISGLYSNAPRDGSIETLPDTLDSREEFISSLLQSGYHRTPAELGKKSTAREQNIGGNLSYNSPGGNIHFGFTTLYSEYSQPFIRTPRIYNGFEFRGKSNYIHSASFSYNYQNHFLFGESAISKSGGTGTVIGLMSSLNTALDLSVLWRQFDRNFHSFYGNAFSEGSRPINEKGIYIGLQFRPKPGLSWSGYFDRFYFPWLKFRVYAPSDGHEWFQRLTYSPSRDLSLFLQVREEIKDRNLPAGEQEGSGYRVASGKKMNYATGLTLNIDKRWSIKSRVQFSSYDFNGKKTGGFAIVQDIDGAWERFRISGRFALFDTEDYDNRQYVYEKNVLWAFSIPNYSDQGMRYYLLAQWDINKKVTCWLRWARMTYTNRDVISSGLQAIHGNTMTETTFQMRYQFNR